MAERNGQAVKQYREGNITAAFGTDLFIHGVTFVPSLLLKWYRYMGLTESEMMLLLHLLRLRTEEKELYPTAETLGELLSGGKAQAERDLESLRKKGIITVTQYFHEEDQAVSEGYDFEPLFEKLSEVWARSKVHEIEKTQAILEGGNASGLEDQELGRLYDEFAKEFGRLLSPIEAEQVSRWYADLGSTLVREALRRAVLIGKHNFKYIDSILIEWHKNNVRTIAEVQEYERKFQQRRGRKPRKMGDVKRDRERERALIKALYIS
jgi:DNA replication protein